MYKYSTRHGIERTRERRHLKKDRRVMKDLRLAIQRGRSAEDFSGLEKSYLANAAKGNSYALAYNGFCYIIGGDDNRCVTMFALPGWFGKRKKIIHTKETRNYKQVCEEHRKKNEKEQQIRNVEQELILAQKESADDIHKTNQDSDPIHEIGM